MKKHAIAMIIIAIFTLPADDDLASRMLPGSPEMMVPAQARENRCSGRALQAPGPSVQASHSSGGT